MMMPEQKEKNISDAIFFSSDVFAARRLQTSCNRIGEPSSAKSPQAAALTGGIIGKSVFTVSGKIIS
jgi:hypothetical protein